MSKVAFATDYDVYLVVNEMIDKIEGFEVGK